MVIENKIYFKEIEKIRLDILEIAYHTKEGHIASSFSIVEILYSLYKFILNISPRNKDSDYRDYFILSKGHASLAYFAILSKFGFISAEELYTFSCFGSNLGGHPDRLKVLGVEVSTGSLGHGLPISCGIALANQRNKINSKTIVLVGDGELNEGSNWEAALFAAQQKLSNLYCIIDNNLSTLRSTKVDNIDSMFKSFGWNTVIVDGHNIKEIVDSFNLYDNNKPTALVASTIKGKGAISMENNPEWHHKSPSKDELILLIDQIKGYRK